MRYPSFTTTHAVEAVLILLGFQVLLLTILAVPYPSSNYRTGLTSGPSYRGVTYAFLLDPFSYFSLLAVVLAAFLRLRLRNQSLLAKAQSAGVASPDSGLWSGEWVRAFSARAAKVFVLPGYLLGLAALRLFGNIETVEPLPITIVWTLDDLLALFATLLVVSTGVRVAWLLHRFAQGQVTKVNMHEPMGGWQSIGTIAAMNAMMVGISAGAWLLPWLFAAISAGSAFRLQTVQIALLDALALGAGAVSMVFPLALFFVPAKELALKIDHAKNQTKEPLKRELDHLHEQMNEKVDIDDSGTATRISRAAYVHTLLDEANRINAWPKDLNTLVTLLSTVCLQLVEVAVVFSKHG